MRRTNMALLLLAAASLTAPAYADGTEWAGFTCGFAASSDPSGLIEQDPSVLTGEMTCGPWTAFDIFADDLSGASSHPGGAAITITGTLQINQPNYGGAAAAKATCTGSGSGIASTACVISYSRLATDSVYLCTHVTMDHQGVHEEFTYDDDDNPANGSQCALATSANT